MTSPRYSQSNFRSLAWIGRLVFAAALIGLLVWGFFMFSFRMKNRPGRDSAFRYFLSELNAGLEDYRIDHGSYPLNPPVVMAGLEWNDELAQAGASVLYQHLSGDLDLDGVADQGAMVYVEHLDYWSNSVRDGRPLHRSPRCIKTENGFAVIDPKGSLVRYLAEAPTVPMDARHTRNPAYDLWLIGSSKKVDDPSTWITNWGDY